MRSLEGAATVPKKVKRLSLGTKKNSENSAMRQFLFAKELRGTRLAPWTHRLGSKLVPKRTKYLGNQWDMATTRNNVNHKQEFHHRRARCKSQDASTLDRARAGNHLSGAVKRFWANSPE